MQQKITPADIPAGPLAGATLNVWTVKSGREHIEGCGRLSRSKPNVTRTITIPHDAHLDYLWERRPVECDTCMKHHPYIELVRTVLHLSDWFHDVYGVLQEKLDIERYDRLLDREDFPQRWLKEVPEELAPLKERLRTDRVALIERWATEIAEPAAKLDMLAYLFGYRKPPRHRRYPHFRPETQEQAAEREAHNAAAREIAKTALEARQWTLIVQRDLPRHWRLLTRQYWSASRSLDTTLTAVMLPTALVEDWLAQHQTRPDEPPPFKVAGTVPDDLASDNFCDTFLRCLPAFMFRSFGSMIHPQQQSLDVRPFFDQAVEGKAPDPAETPAQRHVYSDAVLEEARGYLSDVLYELDLSIADWNRCGADEDDEEELDAEEAARRKSFHEDVEELFVELSGFVRELPLDDPLIAEAATYLRPIWDDDDGKIEGLGLYPYGSAYCFLDRWMPKREQFRMYLRDLMDCLAMDWRAWQDLCAFYGADARWPLPKGVVWYWGDKPIGGDTIETDSPS